MSGELAVRSGGDDLAGWAERAQLVHQMAIRLASTSFVPRSMQNRPEECTAAILTGAELGLGPMASLRSLDVIEGVPCLRAMALRGLVQAAGHDVWLEDSTETRAVVCGRRKGSAQIQKSVWTMERARKANLAGKKNWATMPTAMLVARATAEVCRLIGADVLLAMPYVVEELADDLDIITEAPTVSAKSAKRTAQRKALPAPAPPPPDLPAVVPYRDDAAPDAVTVQAPPLEDEPAFDAMTEGMRRALMAAYRDAGITDRDERLAHAARIVGRPLSSANELSHTEAHELLAALEVEAVRATQDREAEEEQQ